MSGSVEIPLRESDEVIEIPFSELPEGEEVSEEMGDVRCLIRSTSGAGDSWPGESSTAPLGHVGSGILQTGQGGGLCEYFRPILAQGRYCL